MTVSLAQLPKELQTVLPGNLFNGKIVSQGFARIVAHDRSPISLRDGMNRQVKPLGQRDPVLGFVLAPPSFRCRTAHQEGARWNPGKLHPQAVRDKWPHWLDAGNQQAPQAIFEPAPVRNLN